MKNVNFFLENLSNRVDFLTAKLMNSWKHIDMKQATNITQNSLQIWDIAIHLEEPHKTCIFTKKKRSTAQFTCTTQRAIILSDSSTDLIIATSRPVVFDLVCSIASLQEDNPKIASHLRF